MTVESAATPKPIRDLRTLIEQVKFTIFSSGDEASAESIEDEGEYRVSKEGVPGEDYDTTGDLQLNIGCLVDLGSTIERVLLCAGTGRVRSSLVAPIPFNVSDAASAYVSSIRDKFKDAEVQLIERLGEANWQRHVNVRMRMQIISSGVEEDPKYEEHCSTSKPYSVFHDSGIGTSVPVQTDCAPSHTSFVSTISEKEEGRLRLPREPVEVGAGRPFQCYLCGEALSSIRNRVDWKSVYLSNVFSPNMMEFGELTHE